MEVDSLAKAQQLEGQLEKQMREQKRSNMEANQYNKQTALWQMETNKVDRNIDNVSGRRLKLNPQKKKFN